LRDTGRIVFNPCQGGGSGENGVRLRSRSCRGEREHAHLIATGPVISTRGWVAAPARCGTGMPRRWSCR